MKTAADHLTARRDEFPILSTCTYLISNSLGAMPARARADLQTYADDWATLGVSAWDRWLALVERAGDLIGGIIGAPPGSVTPIQNVSIAEQILISCLDFSGARNKIVYSELDFPTVHYNWLAQERRGARVELVRSADGIGVDVEAICDAIDERTLAVPISHVLFRSGYICDPRPIVEKAHRVGAWVFLDVFQSIGSVPVDVRALGVDAAVGGCLKWLCGGPGNAFVYVNPDVAQRLVPVSVGWFSHQRPFDFDIERFEFAAGRWRYAGGTPNPAALSAALAGLEIVAGIGVETIRARHQEHTAYMVERALADGLDVRSPLPAGVRGGHVTVDFPGAREACDELLRRKVIVDYRPRAGIRIAPHFYNTRDEIDAAFSEIAAIRNGR